MSNNNDNGRRNVSVLGTEDQIFGIEWNYETSDMWLLIPALFGGMAVMVVVGTLHRTLGLVAFAGVLVVTLAYIYVTPASETPHKRLWETLTFWTSPKDLSTVYEGDGKRPESLTHVLRVRPEFDATQREDGTLVGATRVDASSMALATNEEWETAVTDYEDHLNSLQFATVTTVGGRPVSPDIMTDGLDDRLTDPDVRDVPALKDIIRTHQEVFPTEFQRRGTSTRQYHVHVPVSVGEAQLDGHGAVEKLGELPFVGGTIRAIGGELTMKDMDHLEDEQASILQNRLQTVESGLLDFENCAPERLRGDQHGALIEAYWRDETPTAAADTETSRFAATEPHRITETDQ
jgi:hypothetical protein